MKKKDCQLGAVPAADEEGGREAAPRKGEADTEIKRGLTAVPDPHGGCDPAGIRKKGRTAQPSFLFYGVIQAAALTTEVMWGFTPSYQYRKPSMSTTSPTFRALTASYTSVPGPQR